MSSPKVFPFAPGIPWKISPKKVVIPELSKQMWSKSIEDRQPIVSCLGGGLIEHFFSLFFLEVFKCFHHQTICGWACDPKFSNLIKYYGYGKIFSGITLQDIKRFPTPIFYDASNKYAFFNAMHNYQHVYTFEKKKSHKSLYPLFSQMFRNVMVSWSERYLFTLQNIPAPSAWASGVPSHLAKPWVVVFPDATGLSIHSEEKFLHFTPLQLKAFGAMVALKGCSLIILTNHPAKYYDPFAYIYPLQLNNIIHFISKARAVLAQEWDYLALSLLLNREAAIIADTKDHPSKEYDLEANARFLGQSFQIYSQENLLPKQASLWISKPPP